MRNNYTALGKNVHVLDCFSRACAEALMQLGLLERHDAAPDMEAGHYIEVRILSLLEPDDGGQSTSGSSFTIAPDAPLYSEPIEIPTLEVERLLFVASDDRGVQVGGGDVFMSELDGAAPLAGAAGSGTGRAGEDATRPWCRNIERMEEATTLLFQNATLSDVVRLLETLIHFKWIKDEGALNWQSSDPLVRQFMGDIYTILSSMPAGDDGSGDRGAVQAHMAEVAEMFLKRVPRVDCLDSTTSDSIIAGGDTATYSSVHVIDVALNAILRICLSQWHAMGFSDKTVVALPCTFPWFTHDLSIGVALWLTYTLLHDMLAVGSNIGYQQIFHYVRRIMRLSWPAYMMLIPLLSSACCSGEAEAIIPGRW
ncbi:hypothetical protein ERJ75_001171400 [Trypanosoma vivax]|nr:hypothetical protein ERJ75_001171400 [Trypanosoma vivax]